MSGCNEHINKQGQAGFQHPNLLLLPCIPKPMWEAERETCHSFCSMPSVEGSVVWVGPLFAWSNLQMHKERIRYWMKPSCTHLPYTEIIWNRSGVKENGTTSGCIWLLSALSRQSWYLYQKICTFTHTPSYPSPITTASWQIMWIKQDHSGQSRKQMSYK